MVRGRRPAPCGASHRRSRHVYRAGVRAAATAGDNRCPFIGMTIISRPDMTRVSPSEVRWYSHCCLNADAAALANLLCRCSHTHLASARFTSTLVVWNPILQKTVRGHNDSGPRLRTRVRWRQRGAAGPRRRSEARRGRGLPEGRHAWSGRGAAPGPGPPSAGRQCTEPGAACATPRRSDRNPRSA